MSIWNKVLIGLIIPVALLFTFVAMRALKTHQYWRGLVQKMDKKLDTLDSENSVLADGDSTTNTLGVRQLTLALHKLTLNRGRIWTNVTPGGYNAETGALSVKTDLPNPNGIQVGNVLYIFDEAPVQKGGRYLGAFTVTAKADKQLQLQPGVMMTHSEVERLQQKSTGRWVMYDVIPADDHEAFTKLDDAARKAMLPATSAEEYVKDGKVQADGTKFARQLRDYGVLLSSYYRQRSLQFELLAAAKTDNHYLQNALADARKQEQFHNSEINTLKATLADEQRKLETVQAHLQAVEKKLAEVRSGVQELIKANRLTASRIAWIQSEATRKIDQRTQRMAQMTK
jgi:uncharacterized coiled-coil protein SlyX